ncbi:MAG TPA: Ppx/GppA phosphatase family protein [Kineosporiaceae bacterium]|nr:Ppx/GppA phosphatase family protein [Kineosporiaceae bacterium]
MTRVAVVDCGTNSLRLLVADVDPAGGTLTDVDRRTEIVRIGEGVDATGRITDAALERTLAVARFYAALVAETGAEQVAVVATSALRDATNGEAFTAGMRELLGVEPRVVSGDEEARLTFAGAVRALPDHELPALVVDIGGGSTELVLGERADGPVQARSVDVGSVRLTERHLHSDPPTAAEIERARADVVEGLDDVADAVELRSARTLVGVAGTVTTLTAHALALPTYDAAAVDGAVLPVAVLRAACDDMLARSRAERAELPYVEQGRVDVIGGGALVWGEILDRVQREADAREVVTSEHDILDGVAWSVVQG